jgi:hypothetical protein
MKPERALKILKKRWKAGHTFGCSCQSRNFGGPCRKLWRIVAESRYAQELFAQEVNGYPYAADHNSADNSQ